MQQQTSEKKDVRRQDLRYVLSNVDKLCYFGSTNHSDKQAAIHQLQRYFTLISSLQSFSDQKFLKAITKIINDFKKHYSDSSTLRDCLNHDGSGVAKEIEKTLAFILDMSLKDIGSFMKKYNALNEKYSKFLKNIHLIAQHTIDKLPVYDFTDVFSETFKQILKLLEQENLCNWTSQSVKHIQAFIALCLASPQNEDFDRIYRNNIQAFIPLANTDNAILRQFLEEIYPNVLQNSTFILGANCTVLAYIALVESIRLLPVDSVSWLQLKPVDKSGKELEELNFVAVGAWPEKTCWLIVPWSNKPECRIIEWKGNSTLKDVPELLTMYEDVDSNKSIITNQFKCTGENLTIIRKKIIQQTFATCLSALWPFRQKKLQKVSIIYTNFLNYIAGKTDPSSLQGIKTEMQRSSTTYSHGISGLAHLLPLLQNRDRGGLITGAEQVSKTRDYQQNFITKVRALLQGFPLSQYTNGSAPWKTINMIQNAIVDQSTAYNNVNKFIRTSGKTLGIPDSFLKDSDTLETRKQFKVLRGNLIKFLKEYNEEKTQFQQKEGHTLSVGSTG